MAANNEPRADAAAFAQAREAVEVMQRHGAWPTPLNFRLWLDYVADPGGPVAMHIDQLISTGEPITEDRTRAIAALLQDRGGEDEGLAAAGSALGQELATVEEAIDTARRTSESYGASLQGATRELAELQAAPRLRRLLDTLAEDTRLVKAQHQALERRLLDSTIEAGRLRDRLIKGRKEAVTDALTGLPNRKAFDDAVQKAWEAASLTGGTLAVAMIDIDHFKRFNDTWGHQTGDRVLKFVAGAVGLAAAAPRFAGRYGGEEFGVIFTDETRESAMACLEAVRVEIAGAVLRRRTGDQDLGSLTISAGLALLRAGEGPEALLDRADKALYTAKAGGRNRVAADAPAAILTGEPLIAGAA